MGTLKTYVSRFIKEDEGLETVEYAVMTALVVSTIIVAVGALTFAISGRFNTTATTITTPPTPAP